MSTEPVYLPNNWDTLEIECLTHNINEAARIGAKSFVRQGRKELKALKPKLRSQGRVFKSPVIPPENPERLLAEYEAMRHNIAEATKLGAEKYAQSGMRELKRLKALIKRWVEVKHG